MTIKLLLCSLLIFFGLHSSFAQSKEVHFLVDTTISIMKQQSVNAAEVGWNLIAANAHEKAKNIQEPYQLGQVMRYLFESINDFHGAFFYKDSVFQWRPKEMRVSDSIMNEWKKGVKSIALMLDNDIGYLRVPSMPVANQEEFNTKAQVLNDSLCILLNKNIKGIILDLRLNGGGAMHPMILGLEQLLGDGQVGSFHTKKKEDWVVKNHGFYIDTIRYSTIIPQCQKDLRKIPVVMLVSPVTGSSGECLIIAFKGRKNTILIGSKTAGYVTINNGFPINDTAFMNLSVGYSADRNGKIYREAIPPDIAIEGLDKFNDIPQDEKVKAAVRWITNRIRTVNN